MTVLPQGTSHRFPQRTCTSIFDTLGGSVQPSLDGTERQWVSYSGFGRKFLGLSKGWAYSSVEVAGTGSLRREQTMWSEK